MNNIQHMQKSIFPLNTNHDYNPETEDIVLPLLIIEKRNLVYGSLKI
jgi:hypothetical protein